jgi:hypothetical protein
VIEYQTRQHGQALEEARDCLARLARTIGDSEALLAEAGDRADAARERHEQAVHAWAARPRDFGQPSRESNELSAAIEARQEADSGVLALRQRLLHLRRLHRDWTVHLAALEAGADPGDLDGCGGSIAAPSQAGGEGTVEPPPSDPDGSARAPAPERRRARGWWGW